MVICPTVMNQTKAIELLTRSQHRITRTRRLILDAIVKMKGPFSASDILKTIRPHAKGKSIDLVTVYRNFPVFEETGIICRRDFSDEMARFVLAHPGHDHHHHHIVCRACHKVEAIDSCLVEAQEKALAKLGFREINHKLEFSGICRACT